MRNTLLFSVEKPHVKMSEKKYEKKERKQNPVFQEVKSELGFFE